MLILAFAVIAAAMGFYVLYQSRAPMMTERAKPKPKARDPLLEARDRLRRQIEIMESRARVTVVGTGTCNPWSEGALEQLRAELKEVERQLGEAVA